MFIFFNHGTTKILFLDFVFHGASLCAVLKLSRGELLFALV